MRYCKKRLNPVTCFAFKDIKYDTAKSKKKCACKMVFFFLCRVFTYADVDSGESKRFCLIIIIFYFFMLLAL